jgi:hypothetical protein
MGIRTSYMLEVARIGRRIHPVVVAAVAHADRPGDEFVYGGIIETCYLHAHVVPSYLLQVSAIESVDSAVFAKHMRAVFSRSFGIRISGHVLLSHDVVQRFRLYDHIPIAHFCAVGAIALARACGEIDIGFESDLSAVTTP